ncbi:MFS transporter [Microbacterium sp. ASV81]|uniref:MFS transporter n=1 Tax=Microbacterium capsulatum TaxID=3041921 RepID=A0ABU0XHE2_9MICO|nr:MFS transporter [Microbacterium sp. ASV81]MDQ4214312.1 MFS transporter [Microbacterium sp. ASV81]
MTTNDRAERHDTAAPPSPGVPKPGEGTLTTAIERIGWTRVHTFVVVMVLGGMFFDALEQDTTGAIVEGLKASFGMGTAQMTLLNTVMIIGGLVGRLLTGWMADRYGRRFVLSFNLVLYTIGGLLSAVAPDAGWLFVTRFIVGVGLGGEFTVGLALVSEIVPTRFRGTVAASLNIGSGGIGNFVAFGLFLIVLGPLNDVLGGTASSWRWLYVFLAVPALLVIVIRRYMPESPRFLLSQGRVDEANRALTVLNSQSLIPRSEQKTLTPRVYVTEADVPKAANRRVPLRSLFATHSLGRTAAIGIASWMSFGAQITLLVLMPTILLSKGYSITASLGFTMIMNLGSLVGASAAAYFAYRFRRKAVVVLGAVLGCLSAIAFASFSNGVALILVLGAVFQFFALLLNTTLAAWSPEIYPTHVRALGTSVVNGIGNVSGAVMPLIAVPLFAAFGVPGVFILLAGMYVLLAIAAVFAPETHGKTLEDINPEDAVISIA